MDLACQGRLCEAKVKGSFGEVQSFGDRDEVAEMTKFHKPGSLWTFRAREINRFSTTIPKKYYFLSLKKAFAIGFVKVTIL